MENRKLEEMRDRETQIEESIEEKKEDLVELRIEIEAEEGKAWCPRCEDWFDDYHECFGED